MQNYFRINSRLPTSPCRDIIRAMKIIIYAAFLPGSTKPDYVGSHQAEPSPGSQHMAWKYQYSTYVGAGAWISRSGSLRIPRSCQTRPWGTLLTQMTPQERLSIRVETLETVDVSIRWAAEARAIREHLPPFNVAMKDGPEVRKEKWNAYQRAYRKGYLDRNPDKAAAKRAKDRERIAAKRAAAKPTNEPPNVA